MTSSYLLDFGSEYSKYMAKRKSTVNNSQHHPTTITTQHRPLFCTVVDPAQNYWYINLLPFLTMFLSMTMEWKTAAVFVALCSIVSNGNAFISTPQQECLGRHRNQALGALQNEANEGPTRREAIQFGALALSSLLVPGTFPAPAYGASEPQTIVLTGELSNQPLYT